MDPTSTGAKLITELGLMALSIGHKKIDEEVVIAKPW